MLSSSMLRPGCEAVRRINQNIDMPVIVSQTEWVTRVCRDRSVAGHIPCGDRQETLNPRNGHEQYKAG